jgi:NhaA family Na+:H+ antiporter
MFAFSATGVRITTDFSSDGAGRIFTGILIALVIGKPLGILLASGLAISGRIADAPEGLSKRQFVGAACLCGIGDTMALLMADRAFGPLEAEVAKLAVLVGSVIAGTLGTIVLRGRGVTATPSS